MNKPLKNHEITSIKVKCRFCGFFDSNLDTEKSNTPWLANYNYSAITSIGGFVSGWSLACPNIHKLNLVDDYQEDSFWLFVNHAVNTVSQRYGKVSVFEHGSCSSSSETSCGTAHAHLHIVPINFSLEKESLIYGEKFGLTWKSCRVKDVKKITNNKEYLFVSDDYNGKDTVGKIALLNIEISQFFRQVIAYKLGFFKEYNYKQYPMDKLTMESASHLRNDAGSQSLIKG